MTSRLLDVALVLAWLIGTFGALMWLDHDRRRPSIESREQAKRVAAGLSEFRSRRPPPRF